MLKKISIAIAGAVLMTFGMEASVKAASFKYEVLVSGLDSPRGITFGPDGALYVTEAGRGGTGPCLPPPTGSGVSGPCYGETGAITRIANGISKRVVTGLPSLASPEGVLAFGPQDIAFDSTGNPYTIIGYAGDPRLRSSVIGNSNFAQLFAIKNLNKGASLTKVADLGAYEAANNPDGDDVVSNPYAFLIQDGRASIVDAGANDLLNVGLDGSGLTVQSVFSKRLITDPSSGANIPLQSVPTSIAIGSDNALYIGELTGAPFPKGGARIYRIDSDNQPEVYLDGFTNINDLVFDSEGNLYVLEFSANSIASGDLFGALIRVAPDGTRTTIGTGSELISPTALALGSDGAIYVANKGFQVGQGEILRIVPKDNSTSVPEPALTSSVLASGACGLLLRRRRRNQLAAK
jgi:hypothetical protein